MKHLDTLQTALDCYDVIFCDVWGVLHNGVVAFPAALRALQLARQAGKTVILLTNAPRPKAGVVEQLAGFGIGADVYDDIVTSGDVTRDLIIEAPRKIFHIGPERDLSLYNGLNVELVDESEAEAVVVTGLSHDDTETPEDYRDILQRMHARDLPMICANPDIIIHRGADIVWCSGALARDYAALGGRTRVAGKPHHPIYEMAQRRIEKLLGKPVGKDRILAIGDGVLTDIKGAEQFGIDVLFISGGIHRDDYKKENSSELDALEAFFSQHDLHPSVYMEALQ